MAKQLTWGSWSALRSLRRNYGIYSGENVSELQRFKQNIVQETRTTRAHLTPEIALRLITPECRLFYEPINCENAKIFPNDPFWAFYWPGGQALSRYILDNPHIVANKSVLDVGSGCGASSLISILNKAKYVIANDIDEVAACAVLLNADLNRLPTDALHISTDDLIGTPITEDVIFLGDIFYDEDIAERLLPWLHNLNKAGKQIFIGDPGRHGLTDSRLDFMRKLKTYNLPENCCIENNGFKYVNIWKFV